MTVRLAIIQPLPGIGDMIWHLPHIRALTRHFGVPATIITKPRSAADQFLTPDDGVADIMWLDRNPEGRRGRHDGPLGRWHLITDLRRRDFEAIVLLHHSHSLAFATLAAGIPRRYGYGYGLQRLFLNRPPFLPRTMLPLHPFDQATAYLAASGIPMAETEPRLIIPPTMRAALDRQFAGCERPFVVIGIGSSEPYKQWGAERFAGLAAGLLDAGWPTLVLVGGKAEAALAKDIRTRLGARADRAMPAIGRGLMELAALFAASSFYVGNDTGVMNMAAAAGTRTYGLFGAVPPFHHASLILPILPPDGRADKAQGMARISVAAVLQTVMDDRGRLGPR